MTPAEIGEVVRGAARVHASGGGSKSALGAPEGATVIDMRGASGILEYDPGEFTVTALAGTPLKEMIDALGRHGQSLPFDPPLAQEGATMGGTIAAGLSGPGRYRFGGVRDFILQTRFVSGKGEEVRAGAKVVKNAAGFDLPKMFVGSLGRLGILTEATFKVFPHPQAYATCEARFPQLASAVDALMRLTRSPFDIEALELSPPGTVWVRLGGEPATFDERMKRLTAFLRTGTLEMEAKMLLGEEEKSFWNERRKRCGGVERIVPDALSDVASGPSRKRRGAMRSAKIPLTPKAILALDPLLEEAGAERLYTAGGQTAWVWWPGEVAALDALLSRLSLAGLFVQGPAPAPGASSLLGARNGLEFLRRAKQALDPDNKFGPLA